MFKLDLQSRQPIYEQLKSKICELVMLGQLKPDDQLPSVRSFARELGINPNTVQKAYQELERNGIVYSVAGRGSYVSAQGELFDQLRMQYLGEIAQVAAKAMQCGIEEQSVIDAVRRVYEEESKNDHGNKTDQAL